MSARYVIERELGRGGMATVYLALDPQLNRPVAIKVLRPELSDLLGRERFLREIAIAAGLQHPNILPLHDSGATDGLLYFVMPYVAGESLRDRLDREKQLPIEDALRICREVADALGCAHAQGVVHRDIKPANILLGEGHALVADFGIARVVSAADAAQLTERGIAVGTPAYMSPEQASGQDAVDGRTDLYALGCVLYEMLAGEPPFSGPTTQAVLARHRFDPVPPLRSVRPSVPTGVEDAILHALEKVPADRFATTPQFVEALSRAERRRSRLPRRMWIPLGLTAAAAILWATWSRTSGLSGVGGNGGPAPDSSRYVIMPFEHDSSVTALLSENQLLHDALTRWSGIAVVDPFQVRDALVRRGGGTLSSRDARRVARELGAGRYVRGDVSRLGDSIRVHAGLYESGARGALLHEGAFRLGPGLAGAESLFTALADSLLFRGAGPGRRAETKTGTRSFPARLAYVRGHAAIERWDLVAADSAFAVAAVFDPQYTEALLWLAQVRSWTGVAPATWRSSAERAAAGRARLSVRDQILSDALLALGRGETERACGTWGRLAAQEPYDFAAWFGLGNCLGRDSAVLRDPRSPSRWRFRSSYDQATSAYVRAFELMPSIHKSLRRSSYGSLRRLLMTSGSALRIGQAVLPDTTSFVANPTWQGDTLAFVPYPRQLWSRPRAAPEASNLAVRRQRERFNQIATAWVTAFPQSPDALEALAISLEMLGAPSALDTLRRARALATSPEDRARVAGAEVWMRVRLAIPSDIEGLLVARALADSVVHRYPPASAPEPLMLASLAALTGRAQHAAAYGRNPAVAAEWRIPAPLALTAFPLLAFAALGGPTDSLRALEQRVDSAIRDALLPSSRQEARHTWLARPATLALPEYRFRTLPLLLGSGDYLLDAQWAFLRGDTAAVRQMFVDLRAARRNFLPSDLTIDALYPEAWLLGAVGEPEAAIGWLEPTFATLPATAPEVFADPARAGALVRAMVLLANLAEGVGDRASAQRWARAVVAMWSDADPFLQPLVGRMRRLAG